MPSLSAILVDLATLRLPAGLIALFAGSCVLLAVIAVWLLVRRVIAARRHDERQSASLFAVREIGSLVLGDGPVDLDHLRTVLQAAPIAAVLQFLRLHRGAPQALVIGQAELAGVFDPALKALGCGIVSREVEALKQLQYARAPRFRSAVLRQVMRGATPQLRCEALYTFIAMGSTPSEVALTAWLDATGPALTPRHEALFHLIAERMPGVLPHLARSVENPQFQPSLAVLAAQSENWHHPLPALGLAARWRAPALRSGGLM
jgi:hypothetical protein